MLRLTLVAALAFVLGFGSGAFAWYAFGPLFYDRPVSEELPADFR